MELKPCPFCGGEVGMIQIDMSMPKCCDECFALDEHGDYPFCLISHDQRGYNFNVREKRMTTCPLKSQEPRVMTLEEVLALKFDDVVYVEVVPTHAVLSAIVLDVIPKLPNIGIGVIQFRYAPTWNGINNADLSYYGKTWRCWTSRPTEEQREATPWN